MKVGTKRVLGGVGAVLGVIVVGFIGVGYSAFGGLAPLVDGAVVGPGATVVKDGISSLGLIELSDGKVALIDAGNDPKGAALLAALTAKKLGLADVEAVFLTHGHPDHTAGCALLPNATVYAFAGDVGLADGTAVANGSITKHFGKNPHGCPIAKTLADGEVVTVGGKKITPFLIPGHTAGSAAYAYEHALFLGDSARITASHAIVGSPGLFADDSAQNLATLRALPARVKAAGLTIDTLVPSHTGVLQGPDVLEQLAR